MKTEILETIGRVVSDVCEVSLEDIRSMSKRGDLVEARSMFVHFCYAYGLQPSSIAEFLNRRRKSSMSDYAYNFHNFSKQSFSFRLMVRKVDEKLSQIFPRQ